MDFFLLLSTFTIICLSITVPASSINQPHWKHDTHQKEDLNSPVGMLTGEASLKRVRLWGLSGR
jgi:hypothetical protein